MTRDQVVRQLHPLQRLAQDEFARVEDERLVVGDGEHLRQVRLRHPRVDEGVAVVAEHAEAVVEVQVHGGRLEIGRVVGVDADSP